MVLADHATSSVTLPPEQAASVDLGLPLVPAEGTAQGKDAMTLHLGLPRHHSKDIQTEIREARRLLKEKVRNDWTYPDLQDLAAQNASTATKHPHGRIAGGFKVNNNYIDHGLETSVHGLGKRVQQFDFEPLGWRERDYSSSSGDEATEASPNKSGKGAGAFKFDSPDSVGVTVEERRQRRKLKRQVALEEELTWNTGLAHFMARRDLWTGAHTSTEVSILESKVSSERTIDSDSATDGSSQHSEKTTTTDGTTPPSSPSYMVPLSPPAQPMSSTLHNLVPVSPPMLQDHPVRSRITSKAYPEIYNRIIVQSRTPSCPINLRVVVHALVQGWKDEGVWPPKIAPLERCIGRKKIKNSSIKQGAKALGKILRITTGDGESRNVQGGR